jgi:uncharacterized protein (DUF58 family)
MSEPASIRPDIDELMELRHRANAISLASHHRVNAVLAGLYASVFRGQGMDFEETREYRTGDEIRYMDWRVTARTGTPHLKVFREERERTVLLCVDGGPHMAFGTRGTFKSVQAARAAALLGWAADGRGDRVGGLIFADAQRGPAYFPPARDRRSLWRLLRTLSEPAPRRAPRAGHGEALIQALDKLTRSAPKGALVLVIADLDTDLAALDGPLGQLSQRREVVLITVDDPADWELPAMGPVHFEAPDGAWVRVDTDDPEGRVVYRQQWERQRWYVERLARRRRVDLIPLRTNADVHRDLVYGLMARARRLGVGVR